MRFSNHWFCIQSEVETKTKVMLY